MVNITTLKTTILPSHNLITDPHFLGDTSHDDRGDADHAINDILNPSLGNHYLRSRRRDRSQTAPEPTMAPESESISIPRPVQPLRRNQTSPLEYKKLPGQLDVLLHAHDVVSDTHASQLGVQDIMHARRIANQINQMLDEQIVVKSTVFKERHELS